MGIELTPYQAIKIHGWLRPRMSLRWTDVMERPDLTLNRLLELELTTEQLYALQPLVDMWVQHGDVGIHHVEVMSKWPLKPLLHLRCDLADIMNMKWSAETMKKAGITFSELCGLGMTPQTMTIFGYTLIGWISLGMRSIHIEPWDDQMCIQVFGLKKSDILRCLLRDSSTSSDDRS